jgi:hypothetical protein
MSGLATNRELPIESRVKSENGLFDIPIGTVRSRLFAARQTLREIWQSAPQMTGGRS